MKIHKKKKMKITIKIKENLKKNLGISFESNLFILIFILFNIII